MRCLIVGTCLLALGAAVARADGPPPVSSAKLRRTVTRYFQANKDYRRGDLITREQAEPLLGRLRGMGLALPDAAEILDDLLPADAFLPEQLASAKGRSFMRQISSYPNAYDRLDRLSRLPRGRQTVRDLIRGPDGYKMLQYMTTSAGGRQMGKQLSNAPGAGKFNAPTGRIYTAEDLLRRLEQSRAAALKPRKKSAG